MKPSPSPHLHQQQHGAPGCDHQGRERGHPQGGAADRVTGSVPVIPPGERRAEAHKEEADACCQPHGGHDTFGGLPAQDIVDSDKFGIGAVSRPPSGQPERDSAERQDYRQPIASIEV